MSRPDEIRPAAGPRRTRSAAKLRWWRCPLVILGDTTAAGSAGDRWANRLEDLLDLMAHRPRLSTDEICRRLGVTPPALYQQLRRKSRGDLNHRLGLTRTLYQKRRRAA